MAKNENVLKCEVGAERTGAFLANGQDVKVECGAVGDREAELELNKRKI